MYVLRLLIWVMALNVCWLANCRARAQERTVTYGAWQVVVKNDEMDDRISCVLRTRAEGATLTMRVAFRVIPTGISSSMYWYVSHPGEVGMKRREFGVREVKVSKRERAWRKLAGKGPKTEGYSFTRRYVRFRFDDNPAYERNARLWRGRIKGIPVRKSEVEAAKAGRLFRVESGRVYHFSLAGFAKAFEEARRAGCVPPGW